jgi:putative nucleotidyltransferase with HDIG domain
VPGSLSHLTRRFFDVLLSTPLDNDEVSAVRGWLSPQLAEIFLSQPSADQRHGFHAATTVIEAGTGDELAVEAALLHDIGKRHADLSVIGRTFASLLIRLRLPLTRRMRLYRDHGQIAAAELEALGSDPLIVDFARHHHLKRPPTIPQPTWDLLLRADEPPKTRSAARARIT